MYGLLSIIIPVYNAEKYLEECISSVLKQTYQNLELILVDDGSTDCSWEIIKTCVSRYTNIKGVRKENGGANSARKKGLEMAAGEYILFIDADDYIGEQLCEKLMFVMSRENVDIVLSKLVKLLENVHIDTNNNCPQGKYTGEFIAENIVDLQVFIKKNIPSGLVANLYKKWIIQKAFNVVDERIIFSEDYVCFLLSLLDSQNVYVLDEYLYFYRQNKDSAMHSCKKNNYESIKFLYWNLMPELKKRNVSASIYKQVEWIIISSLLIAGYGTFKEKEYLYPFKNVHRGSNIVIYGAGSFGGALYNFVKEYNLYNMVLWVDQNYAIYQKNGIPVYQIEEIDNVNYDYIVIAIMRRDISVRIKQEFEKRGYSSQRIVLIDQELISYQELPEDFWMI